jgi:hypothetical protein
MAKRDCSELALKITQMAMNISSRSGVNNLDDVVGRMQEHVPGITREMVVDAIVEATERGPRDTDAVVSTINAIKAEARQDKALQRKIEQLEKALKGGQIPVTAKRARKQASDAIEKLRSIRNSLKKKLATSEPARRRKLEKQIKELEQRILDGDFVPKIKPPVTRQSQELERLEFERDELRRSIQGQIRSMKPKTLYQQVIRHTNIARALKTSFDFSAVFRQGGFLVWGHPVKAASAFKDMMVAVRSKSGAHKVQSEIINRPNAPLYRKAKLYLPDLEMAVLSQREEAYQTDIAQKIPGVAASERAYIAFLNKLRADVFDSMSATLGRNGEVTLEEAQALANFINLATGRGNIGNFEQAAVTLNTFFFAPRLVASRIQILAGTPLWGGNNATRKLIAKEYGKYLIGVGTLLALLKLGFDDDEVSIDTDMRSSDFLKLRIGNTRIDVLSGLTQPVVVLKKTISGERKSTTTGVITRLRGENVPFGGQNVWDVLSDYERYKFAPIFGAVVNLLVGKDPVGGPSTLKTEAIGLITPLAAEEVYEAIKSEGVPSGVALSLMTLFGMSTATYGNHFTEMTNVELNEQIDKYTYKRRGRREDGTTYQQGDPHKGQEQRVKILREELRSR